MRQVLTNGLAYIFIITESLQTKTLTKHFAINNLAWGNEGTMILHQNLLNAWLR